jgi:hypothetical protein
MLIPFRGLSGAGRGWLTDRAARDSAAPAIFSQIGHDIVHGREVGGIDDLSANTSLPVNSHPKYCKRIYILRISSRHSCWPPSGQHVESEQARFGNHNFRIRQFAKRSKDHM